MSVLDELVAGALEDQRTRELTVSLEDVKKATLAAPAPIDATRWLERADGIPVIAEVERRRLRPRATCPTSRTRPRWPASTRRAAQAPSPCSPKAANSSAALTISTRSAPPCTFQCCARTSSSPTTKSSRPAPTGADLVLLIVAALDDAQLKHLLDLAHELGMTVLVGDAHPRRDRTRPQGRCQGDRHQRARPEEPQGGREQIQRTRGQSAR